MRRLITISLIFCLAFTARPSIALAFTPGIRDSLENIIYSQVGVSETGGNNRGPQVEKYLAEAGLGAGYPWCAAFIKWCLAQAGIHVKATAAASSWFPASRVIWMQGQRPFIWHPCSVAGIWFPRLNGIHHVLFIMWSDGKTCRTVEGNTNSGGSREGDQVMIRFRPVWSLYQVADWIDDH